MNWIEERKRQILEERRQAEIDAKLLVEERALKTESDYQKAADNCRKLIDNTKKERQKLIDEIAEYDEEYQKFVSIRKKDIQKWNRNINDVNKQLDELLSDAKFKGFNIRSESDENVELRDKAALKKAKDKIDAVDRECMKSINRLKELNKEYINLKSRINSIITEANKLSDKLENGDELTYVQYDKNLTNDESQEVENYLDKMESYSDYSWTKFDVLKANKI